ncbi:MAG: crossover junction endodeoxyribonuclease RuvC [Clostridia bacterium]|nr:crossover junction endodeoxyribonuclease RuvC [Clostridia bacterium]
MIILGIDPGLATIGYGVIRAEGVRQSVIDYGVITTPAKQPLPSRLKMIYEAVLQLYDRFNPDAVALEELFFNTNITTGIAVAHARGTILTALAQKTENLYEYTPLQVKQSVVGYGRAEKQQVQLMVRSLLNLKETPRPDDAADALAVALCLVNSGMMDKTFRIQ